MFEKINFTKLSKMIEDVTTYVAVALRYLSIHPNKYRDKEIQKIINCLKLDFDLLIFNRPEIDFISNYVHKLYFQQTTFLRQIALDIIFELQSVSQVSLMEKYNFDLLVAMSIGQNCFQRIEKEKICAYKIALLLLRKFKHLPSSITRALISACENKEDSELALIYLKEALIVDDSIITIPEVGNILLEGLCNGSNRNICDIICYSLENNLNFTVNSFFLNQLVSYLFNGDKKKKIKQENALKSITYILQNWSGFIEFGLKRELIQNLLKCLSHETVMILSIFKSLIRIKNGYISISNAFSGFVIYTLHQFNFMKHLLSFSTIPAISSYLHFFSSLVPECNVTEFPRKVNLSTSKFVQTKTTQPLFLPLKKYFIPINHEIQWSISSIDWELVYTILSVVIPINEEFGLSQTSLQMYNVLFEFFSDQYFQVKSHELLIMNKCLYDLLNLLLNYTWGKNILESSTYFQHALKKVVKNILEDKFIEEDNPNWVLFDCIATLMCSKDGIYILTVYNIIDDLLQIGTKCTCLSNCKHLLSSIKFFPNPGLAIPVYSKFLYSKNNEIVKLSIIKLWKKSKENKKTSLYIFQMLLVPYIKSLFEDNEEEKLQITLSVLYKFLLSNEKCIKEIATDNLMHALLSKYSHFIYSIVFSVKEALNSQNIKDEIEWWMNYGNIEYLKIYDESMKYSLCNDQDSLFEFSSIFVKKDMPLIPPHLFQYISKTDEGIELIKESIISLISSVKTNKSVTKLRAIFFALSHFASSPKADKLVEFYKIPMILLDIGLSFSSYILKGTLIACMSLFHITDYFSLILKKYNWRLFQFGQHSVIVPCDVFSLINSHSNIKTLKQNKIEILEDKREICNLFIELLSPINSKNAKEGIINLIQEKPNEIISNDVALYAHRLVGYYSYPTSLRTFIYEIFKRVTLQNETATYFTTNKKIEAIFKAQSYELLKNITYNDIPLSKVQIPQYSPLEISSKNINIEVPEIYIKDNMFLSICSVCKSEFYQLSDEKQEHLRKSLLQ